MDSMDDLVVNATLSSESERSRNSSSKLGRAVKKSSSTTRQATPVKTKTTTKTTPTKNPLHVASPPILNPFNILSALVPNGNTGSNGGGGGKSNSNRSVNSNESNDNKKNANNKNTKSTDNIEANKYNHDIQQARMIQQGIAQRKQQQQQQQQEQQNQNRSHNNNVNNDPKVLTEADVRLGLDGLDQAEELRSRGRTREALKVSELALELLIKFLRSSSGQPPPSSSSSSGARISRDTVEARVLVALSAAEEMKSELRTTKQAGGDVPPSQPSTTTAPAAAAAAVNSLSNSLKAALGKVGGGGSSAEPTANTATDNRQHSPTRSNISRSHTAATTNNPVKHRKKGTPSKPAITSSGSNVPHGKNTSSSSNLLNSQDPLVQTVKNELYIPQQQLQSTTWDDIAGLEDAKQALQEAAILPLIRPDLFSGLRRPRNILLYGPPGTGKTLLVKAIAYESKCLLFICTASSLTSKWHGEGEKLLKTLFEVARQAAPSIIFVDEMDALLSKRKTDGEHEASRRFKTEFLTQMDGIVKKGGGGGGGDGGGDPQKNLLVLGATNTPWDIDDAVLRRFPRRIYIPLPDQTTRTALLSKLLESGDVSKHRLSKKDTKAIVRRLDGFSGSDISSIASEASFGPIRSLGGLDAIRGAQSSDIRPIERQDFDHAIDNATKSVSQNLLKQYEAWKTEQQASA